MDFPYLKRKGGENKLVTNDLQITVNNFVRSY